MAMIHRGLRVSAAKAFLDPVLKRPNLHLATDTYAQRLIFENGRAVGAEIRTGGNTSEVRARREVIVAMGALHSPKILQLSGIGPREVLEKAGVPVYLERDNVGRRMLEHFCAFVTYQLKDDLGYNRQLRTTVRQNLCGTEVCGHAQGPAGNTDGRRDGGLQDAAGTRSRRRSVPGAVVVGRRCQRRRARRDRFPRRGLLRGRDICDRRRRAACGSRRPTRTRRCRSTPTIWPPTTTARRWRVWFARSGTSSSIRRLPSTSTTRRCRAVGVASDDEIIDAAIKTGATGSHAVATCAMGPSDEDIVDDQLRVRGVEGLRIVDCSIMPTMVSGNLTGPILAMAWRAAELILDNQPAERFATPKAQPLMRRERGGQRVAPRPQRRQPRLGGPP